MYCITATNPDESSYVIYDPLNTGSLPVISPRETDELNEAGSLEFALVYGHEAYGQLIPKKTYITVELDGQEIFYGRVINAEPSPLTSQIQYSCAGALSLLQDSEVLADGKKSDGSSDSQTMTAQAFFEKCIQRHNADVNGDTRRTFQVGIVNHPKRADSRTYQISSNVDTLSAIKQFILDYYGGFLRVRKGNNGVHLIDWVEQYGATDEGTLDLGSNIISMANRFSAENVFTSIRPVGANGITLPNNGVMDVFSQAEMAEYGRIVKTVQFNSADTEAKLRAACQDMIDRMHKTMYISSEISLVDMHFVDGEDHGVNLGDVYTQINGLEGTPMTVSARNRDFNNPQNDSVSLKNPKQFDGNRAWDNGGSSSISKRSARSSAAAGMSYKYIHEFQDQLELNAKQIGIHAEELGLHADQLEITGNNIATLSRQYGEVYDEIGAIKGSAVLQNSDAIAAVAGRFVYDEINHTLEMMNGTEFRVHDSDGATITVGDRITQLGEKTAQFEGSALWTNRDGIVGVSGEFDVVEKDGKRTLVVKSGGGMQVRRDNVEYGIYDSGNLTGGLMVEKLNDGGTATHLRGDLIDLTTNSQHQELASSLVVTEESIRSDVSAANSRIYSYIQQTASNISYALSDAEQGLYTYVDNTADGTRQQILRNTNKVFIQDADPKSDPQTASVKEGDVWVESTLQGTWDGAEGFNWEHDEGYDWTQIQGAKVWTYKNDKWQLAADQTEMVSYSDVINTVDHYLNLKIKAIVNDQGMIDVYMSKLEQTAYEIRSEVYRADSAIYSFINQTATNINIGVGSRPTNVRQKGEPATVQGRNPVNGDIWIDTEDVQCWDDALDLKWEDETSINWNKLRDDIIKVYKDGEWVVASDGTILADDVDMQFEHDHIGLLAHNIDTVDGRARENYAELKVTASQIDSKVEDRTNQLYSHIRQTATEIRAEVSDANNGLRSVISQTASQIRSEVSNSVAGLQSSITQTAESINLNVTNTRNELQANINVQSNRIGLVVEGTGANAKIKAAQVVTAINAQTGTSSVLLSADKIRLDGNVTLSGAMSIQDGSLSISRAVMIGSDTSNLVTVNNGTINTTMVQVRASGGVKFVGTQGGEYYDLTTERLKNMIRSVSVSGNVLTLTPWYGDPINFSKATSLSGEWGSGSNKYTVTAKQAAAGGGTVNVGNISVYPVVNVVSSQGGVYTDVYVATAKSSGSGFDNHGSATRLTLSNSGQVVSLKNPSGSVMAMLTVPNQSVTQTASWSNNTYTVAAKRDGTQVTSVSVTPFVRPVVSQGQAYTDVYMSTGSGTSSDPYVNHGTAKRLTMAFSGSNVNLKDSNNTVYAQLGMAFAWDNSGKAYGDTSSGTAWTPTSRSITVGGISQWIGIQEYSWSSGKKAVRILKDSWSGTAMAGFDISAPTVSLSGSWGSSSNTYTVSATHAGVSAGSTSVSPVVNAVSSQGNSYTDVYVATGNASSGYTNHGGATRLTLSNSGQTVSLKNPSGGVLARLTVPDQAVTQTDSWSSNTYTVVAKRDGTQVTSISVSPVVHLKGSSGAYMDVCVATKSNGSVYTDHGSSTRLTMASTGTRYIYLKDDGNSIYAQLFDNNLVAGNIKKNVSIFGVTGTYEGSGGTITKNDIDIPNSGNAWYPSSYSPMPSADATLNNLGQKIPANNVGYVYFQVNVKGVTKVYRISVDTRG